MNTLLGIDGQLSTEAKEASLQLVSAWPLWLFLLVAAAMVLLVVSLYRKEGVGLSGRAVLFFTILRVGALLILLLMLFEPVLEWIIPIERSTTLLVVLDDSQSMSVSDRYADGDELVHVAQALWPASKPKLKEGEDTTQDPPDLSASQTTELAELTRAGLVNRLLLDDRDVLDELAGEFDLQLYLASENLRSADMTAEAAALKGSDLKLDPIGSISRLGDLIREAVARNRGRVAGVVLVSDGAVNAGEDFESLSRYLLRREIPVFSVGIGDPRQPPDLRIRAVEANRVALVGDLVTVNVLLESTGYRGEIAELKLLRDGRPVLVIHQESEKTGAKVVLTEETIEQEDREVSKPQEVSFAFRADLEGTFTYSVVLDPRPEELVTDNNRVDVPVRVLNERIKVLYIEGPPRWEYRYVKNALTRDETIDLSCVLASADFEFAQEGDLPISYFPAKEKDLFAYDVVIMGDLARNQLTDEQLAGVVKLVEKLGGGMLMMAGTTHAPTEYRGTVIEKMLPVDLDRRGLPVDAFNEATQNKLYNPTLTLEGRQHPMTRFVGDVEANAQLWSELPGFFWHYPITRAKPGATVLLTHPYARSSYGPEPLLCVQYYGSGKCAFMAFDSTWRWRDRVGDRYQARFWGQIVRELSQNKLIGKSKRFRVSTSKDKYRLGEKVNVFAQVLDERFEPINAPAVEVEVQAPGLDRTTLKLSASVGEPGSFRGEFMPPALEKYTLKLVTSEIGLPEEAVTHSFLVGPSMLEFQDVGMNRSGLVKLTDLTGGRFFHVDELHELVGSILQLKESWGRQVNDDLWNAPLLFILFSVLFVTELMYRKRRRLL